MGNAGSDCGRLPQAMTIVASIVLVALFASASCASGPDIREISELMPGVDVVAVIQFQGRLEMPDDAVPFIPVPARRFRNDFSFKWVDVWYRSPFTPVEVPEKPCRLILHHSAMLLTVEGGTYLAFLTYKRPGEYGCAKEILRVTEGNVARKFGNTKDLFGSLVPRLHKVPLDVAKRAVLSTLPEDQCRTYITHKIPGPAFRAFSWRWRPGASHQRVWLYTRDPLSDSFSMTYNRIRGFVESWRFADLLERGFFGGDQNRAYEVRGEWISGAYVIRQITDLEAGQKLLVDGPEPGTPRATGSPE
ncbi:MAG: hypothetical protein GY842_00785 [bacterium]|nr:hypothetical protein [bacterium]